MQLIAGRSDLAALGFERRLRSPKTPKSCPGIAPREPCFAIRIAADVGPGYLKGTISSATASISRLDSKGSPIASVDQTGGDGIDADRASDVSPPTSSAIRV